jgi:MFS transporter, FHS family, L-fucose permease
MTNEMTPSTNRLKLVSQGFLVPFILITSLFFLWGIAHGMLDTLNKAFSGYAAYVKSSVGNDTVFSLYGLFWHGIAGRLFYEKIWI